MGLGIGVLQFTGLPKGQYNPMFYFGIIGSIFILAGLLTGTL